MQGKQLMDPFSGALTTSPSIMEGVQKRKVDTVESGTLLTP